MKRRSFLGSIIAVPAVACCERRLPSWTPTNKWRHVKQDGGWEEIEPVSGNMVIHQDSPIREFVASRGCEEGQMVAIDGPGRVMPAPRVPDSEWILGVAKNSARKGETVRVFIQGWAKVKVS